MNPALLIAWASSVADLIRIGKTTYEEFASLFKKHTHGTDLETSGEDDQMLAALQIIIADYRAKAAQEAGQTPTI